MKFEKYLWPTGILFIMTLALLSFCAPSSQKPKIHAEIVSEKGDGNEIIRHERTYMGDRLIADTEIEKIGLYHGKGTMWNIEKGYKELEGQWKYGYWTGEWRRFDETGRLISITIYRTGSPIAYSQLQDGKMVQIPKEKWPKTAKKRQSFPTGIKGESGGPSPEFVN